MIKLWDDNKNAGNTRPDHIMVSLLANGEVIEKVRLDASNGWKAMVSNLPRYDADGKEIAYTWKEQNVMGYDLTDAVEEGNATTFTNTLWTRPEEPGDGSKGKKAQTPGPTVTIFDEYMTPLGVEVVINHVGDCFD